VDASPVFPQLALPWLHVRFPGVNETLWPFIERAAVKFSAGGGVPRRSLTARVTCDAAGDTLTAAAVTSRANASFQFVAGVEHEQHATYATADGSIAHVDHAARELHLRLNRAVFDAPYSTWADLLAAPLSAHWRASGFYPLHAAAVSFDRTAALIVGESGAGKTTMALALSEGGGRWRADDKLLLDTESGPVRAVSLYRNTNLAPATIAHHASLAFALARAPINETNDKRPCGLDEVSDAVDLTPFLPTAVLFPRQIDAARSRLRPLSQVDALMRLAAQSPMYGWPPRLRSQQRVLAALTAQAAAWEVETGRDVLDDRAAFVDLVRRHVDSRQPCLR
jgi:hypothetical protein